MPFGSHPPITAAMPITAEKGVWGRPPRYSGFEAFDWKAGNYATISNRIDMGTAKILQQLPTVERTSSRISNKRVENKRLGTDCGSGGRWFESLLHLSHQGFNR